jgi:hypothetical protein
MMKDCRSSCHEQNTLPVLRLRGTTQPTHVQRDGMRLAARGMRPGSRGFDSILIAYPIMSASLLARNLTTARWPPAKAK